MTEHPILFSAPMVVAILEGRKTQTRRIISRQLQHPGWTAYRYFGPSKNDPACRSMAIECGPDYPDDNNDQVLCPYGAAGDRLWVRETWTQNYNQLIAFRADGEDANDMPWRPSIFMPRWASRITLEVIGVRVERLQRIRSEDALAEGIVPTDSPVWFPVDEFQHLWDQINAKRAPWASNPWVWVVEFRRVTPCSP